MDAIVSVTSDWAIGKDGGLLVPNRADMRRFVQLTRGCTVLMGRRTLESFPGGPLKGRRNVIVTHDAAYVPPKAEDLPAGTTVDVVTSPQAALDAMAEASPLLARDPATAYRLHQAEEAIVSALVRGLRAAGWREPAAPPAQKMN